MKVINPGPGDTVWMRASGLSDLFDCAHRWWAKFIARMKSPVTGRSHLGSAVHWATAQYDTARMNGDWHDVEGAIDEFHNYFRADAGVHWTDIRKDEADRIGVALVHKYCTEIAHQFEFVKVEAVCEPIEVSMPNNITFALTGTVDRVYTRRVNGKDQYGIVDLKTSGRIIRSDGSLDVAKHGAQLAVYEILEMMAKDATGLNITLPALVIGASTSGEPRILWEEIQNPRTLLFGDGDNMGYLIAASYIIEGQAYVGNPRSQLCSPRYCPAYPCFYVKGA